MTIWRMRIECWIPKATNTHSGCIMTYCFSTVTMVVRRCLDVTLRYTCTYVHCLASVLDRLVRLAAKLFRNWCL